MQTDPRYPRWRVFYVVTLSLFFVIGEAGWPFIEPARFELPTLREHLYRAVPNLDLHLLGVPDGQRYSSVMPRTIEPLWQLENESFPTAGIAVQNDALYINDGSRSLQVVNQSGEIVETIPLNEMFTDFEVLSDGRILIVNHQRDSGRMQILNQNESELGSILFDSSMINSSSSENNPIDVVATQEGIFALDFQRENRNQSPRVYQFDTSGAFTDIFEFNHLIQQQARFAVDSQGNLFVPSVEEQRIIKINRFQNDVKMIPLGRSPLAVAVDQTGRLFILTEDIYNLSVLMLDYEIQLVAEYQIENAGLPRDIAIWGDQIIVSTSNGVYALPNP